MFQFNKLRILLAVCAGLALWSLPAAAKSHKGDKYVKAGQKYEIAHDWENALKQYELALATDPDDLSYRMDMQRMKFQASQTRADQGVKLRLQGKVEEAMAEFKHALELDPSSSLARQELERTQALIDKMKANKGNLSPEMMLTPIEHARQEAEARLEHLQPAPELKPLTTKNFSSLRMNKQKPRVLYETVAKLAGINVIIDPDGLGQYERRDFDIDLTNTNLDDALDYLALLTKTYWKPISSNAIFVTQDNVGKRREYEDVVVKTFYLKNIGGVQELTELSTALRAVTTVSNIFPYNSQFAVMIRAPKDKMTICEKLIDDMDKPRPEVIVDILVLEATRSKSREIGAYLGSGGLTLPVLFNPRNAASITTSSGRNSSSSSSSSTTSSTSSGNSVQFPNLAGIDGRDLALSIPDAVIKLFADDRQVRVMQNPQVRALDGYKATLHIGDKIPFVSGTFQSGVGVGTGLGGFNSTVQQQDVGVKVDLTPKVHGNDEISMHIEFEFSTVRDNVQLGGISYPLIGSRRVAHDIRIRNGEATILAGLNQNQETNTKTGLPGLLNIPLLRRVLGDENISNSRGDLLIILSPRIVRQPDVQEINTREIYSGTEQTYTVKTDGKTDSKPAPTPVQTPPPSNVPLNVPAEPIKPKTEGGPEN